MSRPGQLATFRAAVLLSLGVACGSDAAGPVIGSSVALSKKAITQVVGDTTVIDVQALDSLGNPLVPTGVAATSLDTLVAGVARLPDSLVRNFPGQTLTRIVVRATGMGRTRILVTASGVTDTLTVTAYPRTFTGTITPTNARPGDTLVITTPAGVTFSTTASATGLGGVFYKLVSRSTTQLKYLAGNDMTQLTITGGLMLDTVPLPALVANTAITVTQPNESANGAAATAPSIALKAAIGDSVIAYGTVSATDVHDWFTITAQVGDSLEIEVDWPAGLFGTQLDIDALLYRTNGSSFVSTSGGTSANPERVRVRLTATHGANPKLDVEMYDNHGNTGNWPYRIRLYRR